MKLVKLLLFFLFIPLIIHAQTDAPSNIDSLAKYFLKYVVSFDKEKILLQTDRHIYRSGETIYFKAFLIDSISNQLRNKPKKLYVDIVNKSDSVLRQLLLNASNLKTNGEFVLNDSLEEGFYWIRAYTEKMISNNLGDITVVPVYVVNAAKRTFENEMTAKKESIDSAASPVVHVFPEGGNIISGLNSTVALKVTDQHGNPLVIQGIVKDNADKVYAKFITNSHGLAKFSIYPIWYHRYAIYFLNKDKYDSVAALPPINFFAGQLAVIEQTDNKVKVRIALEDSIFSKDYTTYLFAVSGDSICYSAIGKGMYDAEIPLNNFSHGVARLILFNTKKQLLSERDIFIKKENYHISISTDKDNYGARENVKVDVTLTDKNNKPLLATLAFSVTDLRVSDTIPDDFMNDTLESFSVQDADLVMLTHKNEYANRRANSTSPGLKTINTFAKMPGKISSEQKNNNSSFTISGMVVNRNDEPAAKKLITIFSNQDYSLLNTDTTDINGRFKIGFPDFSDNTRFVVQVSNLKGIKEDEYKVFFDTVSMPHFITPVYLKKKFHVDSVEIGSGTKWLKPVIIVPYKKPEVTYDKSKRINPFSYIITPEQIGKGAKGAGNALLMVPGVHSTGNSITIGGLPTDAQPGKFSFPEPLVVLDGVIVTLRGETVLDFINSIPVASIDFIEVLRGPEAAIYGMQGGDGAVVINTRSGPGKKKISLTGLSSFYAGGFHTAQPFLMPDYHNKEMRASSVPDLRTTIYWNGNIIANKEGKATLHFFTADKPATYLITITGVSANGDKIYKTATISRK
jgi:hypothetical protein